MRNLIDIISKSLLETVTVPVNESFVLAEAKQFEVMFNSLESLGQRYHQNEILEAVQRSKNIVRNLKRTDRQVWGSRLLRISMFDKLAKWSIGQFDGAKIEDDPHGTKKQAQYENFLSEVVRLDTKYRTEYLKTVNEDWETDQIGDVPRYLENQIVKHYLGIPYSKIQNYVFSKSILDTQNDLVALENEFKERKKSLVTLEHGDKIIITMPDNFVWVMLDRGYCSVEANAMGHCGNAGAKSGDNILSLRRLRDSIDGVKHYEVFLTFILNADGFLGEMKGRGNDKPAARYHSQIVTLLENPIIKGIRGGGWLPKNNFSINDLPEEVREKLVDSRPHLANWTTRFKKMGDSEAFRTAIAEAAKEKFGGQPSAVDTGVAIMQWGDIDEFVEEMSDDEHTKEVAKGEYFAEGGHTPPEDSVVSFMDSLSVQYQIALGEMARNELASNGADEDEIEDFDPSSMSSVYQVFEQYDSDVKDTLERAVMAGEESGATAEAHNHLVRAIKSYKPRIGRFSFSTYEDSDGKTQWVWDAPVQLVVTTAEACKLVDGDDLGGAEEIEEETDLAVLLFDEDEELKINQPYYGYDGFDEYNALESFTNDLDLPDIETAPEMDFTDMPIRDVKAWIESMYDKIPDGFIRKVHTDTLPDDRIRASAKGLFKSYYG